MPKTPDAAVALNKVRRMGQSFGFTKENPKTMCEKRASRPLLRSTCPRNCDRYRVEDSDSYFFPLLPNSSAPHFLAVASITSLEDSATGGKSFIHSYGRVASMIARELKPFFPT